MPELSLSFIEKCFYRVVVDLTIGDLGIPPPLVDVPIRDLSSIMSTFALSNLYVLGDDAMIS